MVEGELFWLWQHRGTEEEDGTTDYTDFTEDRDNGLEPTLLYLQICKIPAIAPVFQLNLYRRLTLPHSSYINRFSCYGATYRQMH